MTDKQAKTLAKQIRSESIHFVRIKHGRTNGRNVLHVRSTGDIRQSVTITHRGEWLAHPWNKLNRRRPKDADQTQEVTNV